ncbi:hypothetical protein [Nostoc sp.]|uniref:hypothetical protein n=1 Tax=Nostoc sp. TaxID=1180 RepID=UPI002FF81BE1
MVADAGDMRSYQSGVFEWAGGIGAEVFGVVGETESGLFDGFGGKSIELVRIRSKRLIHN